MQKLITEREYEIIMKCGIVAFVELFKKNYSNKDYKKSKKANRKKSKKELRG